MRSLHLKRKVKVKVYSCLDQLQVLTMSNKMTKANNTFRFISFHERLKNIHVDVVRRRHRLAHLPESNEQSFFYEALEKWSDLDGTQHYDDFKSDIPSNADLCRYAQILHHQKALSEALRRHLAVENSLCSTALLELTVAFCCDLQRDFYEEGHFWPFCDAILALVTPASAKKGSDTNPELLENVFSTLAHLLKLCWAPMCKRLPDVYDRLRPLLSHRRSYLRRFSSEALSFLVRKTYNFKDFLLHCLKDSDQNLAELLFEAMRGTNKSFHSRAGDMLTATLDILEAAEEKTVQNVFELSTALHPMLSKHAVGEFAKPLLVDVLLERALLILQRLEADVHEGETKTVELLEKYIRLLSIWRTNCKGKTFFELCLPKVIRDLLLPILERNLISGDGSGGFGAAFLELASSVFGRRGIVDEYRREFEKFTKKLFHPSYDKSVSIELRSSYVTSLAESSSDGCGVAFELVCLPALGDFVERIAAAAGGEDVERERNLDAVLACYCRILTIRGAMQDSVSDESDVYDLYPGKRFTAFRDFLAKKISNSHRTDSAEESTRLACVIAVFGTLIAKETDQQGRKVLEEFLARLVKNPTCFGSLVLYATIHSLTRNGTKTSAIGGVAKALPPNKWIEIFESSRCNDDPGWVLREADRKRKIAEEAVANPEAGARRKIRKQKKKAESRTRKWAHNRKAITSEDGARRGYSD